MHKYTERERASKGERGEGGRRAGIRSGLIKVYNYVGTMHVSPETGLCCSSYPILLPSGPLHIWTQTSGKSLLHSWYHRFTSLTSCTGFKCYCGTLAFLLPFIRPPQLWAHQFLSPRLHIAPTTVRHQVGHYRTTEQFPSV